jgi:hypothetical protein
MRRAIKTAECGGLGRGCVQWFDCLGAGPGDVDSTVVDSLGARVAGASVMLLRDGARGQRRRAAGDGTFLVCLADGGSLSGHGERDRYASDARTTDPL